MSKGLGGNIGCRDKTSSTFAVKFSAGETWILCTGMQSTFIAVASREISSTAPLRMKLLLPIETHVAVYELQATHKPTIAGLLLQNCVVIHLSLLRGLWNSGAAPAGVHRRSAIGFGRHNSKYRTTVIRVSCTSIHFAVKPAAGETWISCTGMQSTNKVSSFLYSVQYNVGLLRDIILLTRCGYIGEPV